MEVAQLRHKLMREELHEYWVTVDALYAMDKMHLLEQVAGELADLLYVVLGAATAWGIDIEPIFREVHAANMRKFEGGTRRDDGKWLKPADWMGPDVAGILRRQMD
jgi:predicted HAD superfamily Cof-like phosphohydrolase